MSANDFSKRRQLIALAFASPVGAISASSAHGAAGSDVEGRSTPFSNHGGKISIAPFGGAVSASIENYNRASPYIATAGLLLNGGLEHAQSLGFEAVLDLRGNRESGVSAEAALASRLGITRIHLPITDRAPTNEQVARFSNLVHESKHFPMLVHCVSSNRSGALWALYRASVGVDPETVVEEGRACGLASREGAVRKRLGIG